MFGPLRRFTFLCSCSCIFFDFLLDEKGFIFSSLSVAYVKFMPVTFISYYCAIEPCSFLFLCLEHLYTKSTQSMKLNSPIHPSRHGECQHVRFSSFFYYLRMKLISPVRPSPQECQHVHTCSYIFGPLHHYC